MKNPATLSFVVVNMVVAVVGNAVVIIVLNWRWRSTGATKVSVGYLEPLETIVSRFGPAVRR